MNSDPNLQTNIVAYFERLVAEKQRAGIDRIAARKSAGGQIYHDAREGLLDREAAIEFLVTHEVGQGRTPEAARLVVNQYFNVKA